jgi:phage protein D
MPVQTDRGTAQIHIEIDGSPAAAALANDLVCATVESAARLPDWAELRFHDLSLQHSESNVFELGKRLRIELGDSEARKEVFVGEVTSVELDLGTSDVTTLVVTAYDRTHRLHRGRKNRVFKEVLDSDIAREIARDHSLRADVESSGTLHAHVLQDGQTDWEFLTQRAAAVGYEAVVYDDTLYFKPPPARPSDDVELVWQGDLVSLRARITAFEQVDEVEVRGWDALKKEMVSGAADRPNLLTSVGRNTPGGEATHNAYNHEARLSLVSGVARTDIEAKRIAQAVLDDVSNNFLSVEGSALGNPALRAGGGLVLQAVGQQFSGRYVVNAVRHQYDSLGHRVHFKATGHRSADLLSSLPARPRSEMWVMPGLVTDNRDADNAGRVKVKFPMLGDDIESHWCRLVATGAGDQRGIEFLPEINDEVLVLFSPGGVGYVLGGMWSRVDAPPLSLSDALEGRSTRRRIIKSRAGHFVEIDDDTVDGGIRITSADGQTQVEVAAGGKTVEITADTIKLHARRELMLESDGQAKLKAQMTASIEAAAPLTLKAPQISAGR